MPILIQNVSKKYGALCVLNDISMEISDGSFVTILGGSGCGKSTLLNMIAGLTLPDGGRVIVDSDVISGPGPDRIVVFQQPSLYPWLSLRNNISFGLKISKGASNIDWDGVDSIIRMIGLAGFENHMPYELSGGMQQRAAIARALVMKPHILLMDEPFGALDAITRHTMQQLLMNLWERLRTTIIFVTHDVDEALMLGDRLIVMGANPGRIVVDEPINIDHPRFIDELAMQPEFIKLKKEAMKTLGASH
jgi:NitT/TauT family transport system ATP-binding protein